MSSGKQKKHYIEMENSKNRNRNSFIFSSMDEDRNDFYPIIADGDDDELFSAQVPETLPILPLRNAVLFPGVVMPISVGRSKSLSLVREAYSGSKLLGAVAQRNGQIEDPALADLYPVGTMAEILKILEMPDGTTTVILQGKKRILVEKPVSNGSYLMAVVHALPEAVSDTKSHEFFAIIESLKDFSLKIAKSSSNIPQEAQFAVRNIENVTFLVNFICNNTELSTTEKQELLECNDIKDRSTKLLSLLMREVQMLELKKDIQQKVKIDLDQQQREYLLHQQIKTIQDELGGSPVQQEIEELKKRATQKLWKEDIQKLFEKELGKLSRMNPAAGEYSVQIGYLDTLLDLPWNLYTEDNFDLRNAEKVLNEDHFGLDNVKERILEHLAVLKLKGDMKSPIICLYGPPGVGKTSLGRSVASALGRKYIRMSLGGLHDESEIRGHRKTYIGAMPGRIIQNLIKAGSANPVFILDEMITGFRWHMKGAQHVYGVTPDLCTFGKAMANGFAVACIGGRREIMELGSIEFEGRERVFLLSTTHGAEMSGLGAFIATMSFMQQHKVVEHLWDYGQNLINMMQRQADVHGISQSFKLGGIPCSPYYLTLNENGTNSLGLRTLFSQEMIRNGVLMPWIALSYRHGVEELSITEHAIDKTFSIYKKALEEGVDKYLEGPIIKPVFRKVN